MDTTTIALVFAAVSYNQELPPGLLEAVCWVESKHEATVLHHDDNGSDSIGLCQLKLATARFMGYQGTAEGLLNPVTNAYYAGLYLHRNLNRYGHNPIAAISAYNAGKSKLRVNRPYVYKVMKAWEGKH